MQKIATSFFVEGQQIKGFFFKPARATANLPIILMLNGYATEWQFGTAAFIQAFTHAGFATLNIDYRGFGGSEGELHQLMDIPAQCVDAQAALAHVLAQSWVDKSKVFVWGSSLGGGHGLTLAAKNDTIAGLVVQVPHCDSRAAFKSVKLSAVFKGMGNAILDVLGSKIGCAVRKIPVLAEPENYAVMNHPGWYAHYLHMAQGSPTWENAIPARSLLRGADYRPALLAENIHCPVLLMAGEFDAGVPIASVKETAEKIPHSHLHIYAGDHFAVYGGPLQAELINKQVAFLRNLAFN